MLWEHEPKASVSTAFSSVATRSVRNFVMARVRNSESEFSHTCLCSFGRGFSCSLIFCSGVSVIAEFRNSGVSVIAGCP